MSEDNEKLFNLLEKWVDGDLGLNALDNKLQEFYCDSVIEAQPKLVALDEYELYKVLSDYAVLPTHAVNIPEQRKELSKFICSKFHLVPTIEEIEYLIFKWFTYKGEERKEWIKYCAEAIHRLLQRDK